MSAARPLRIGIVAGEESGDLLAADIIAALTATTGREIELIGVGGRHLEAHGLRSLFPAQEIALMGLSAVIRDLPRLIKRIGSTARTISEAKPDCLITIDSPDFTLRVAKKVRALAADIPIVHYVCPSVWAWRPGRAVEMKPYVDHILCILPFEPAELVRLGGPPGTFVGHRLTSDPALIAAAAAQAAPRDWSPDRQKTLLILPGSRRGEVSKLIGPFGETVSLLRARGNALRLVLPTVPHVEAMVRQAVSGWEQKPEIVTDAQAKWQAFGQADAALVASGTVSLELALVGVPMFSCYKLDAVARMAHRFIKVWSALLPNLIADRPVAPEAYDEFVRPQYLARALEQLFADTPMRAWQTDGFAEVTRRMSTDRPSGELAAEIVLREIEKRGR
ncbi:MAG: lipid-A-disaccharide synthase [Mesorhizobium sp.]|nr:lipid-A-disaccharide synthase [Mesorhizobium sp.]MBL8579627.1 lipid-A-disaccharide synthase [Mesorhizobium sp.]